MYRLHKLLSGYSVKRKAGGEQLLKFRLSQYAASQTQSESFYVERWYGRNKLQTHCHAGEGLLDENILEERGLGDQIHDLKRKCPKFHCPPDRTDCCIRRTLYSQSDFRSVTSLLEKHCGGGISRCCSSPSSTWSLILSSNAGGVRSGTIANSLLRQGRKTLEEMP